MKCLGGGKNLSVVLTCWAPGIFDQVQNKVARTGEPGYPIGSVSIW